MPNEFAETGTASNACGVALESARERRGVCGGKDGLMSWMLFLLSMTYACFGWRWQILHA